MFRVYDKNNKFINQIDIDTLSNMTQISHEELYSEFSKDILFQVNDLTVICFYDHLTDSEVAYLYKLGCNDEIIVNRLWNLINNTLSKVNIDVEFMSEVAYRILLLIRRKYDFPKCKVKTFIDKSYFYHLLNVKEHIKGNRKICNLYSPDLELERIECFDSFNLFNFEEFISKCKKLNYKEIVAITESFKNGLRNIEIYEKYKELYSSDEYIHIVIKRALKKIRNTYIEMMEELLHEFC